VKKKRIIWGILKYNWYKKTLRPALSPMLSILRARTAKNRKATEEIAHLLVKVDRSLNQIPLEDIVYLESDGNYLVFHSESGQYRYRATITKVMKSLPSESFVQTHRTFIVNKQFVSGFDSSFATINGEVV